MSFWTDWLKAPTPILVLTTDGLLEPFLTTFAEGRQEFGTEVIQGLDMGGRALRLCFGI